MTVTLRNRMLVDVEDQVWLNQLDRDDVTSDERRALVAARREGAVTPRDLRGMVPETDVDTVLAQSVAKGLLTRVGRRGGSRYVLSDAMVRLVGSPGMVARNRKRQSLLDEIRRRGSLSTTDAATLLDTAPAVAREMLNELVKVGLARAVGRTRARRYYLR
ncbi:MAG: DeoR family transcriptional regulator [Acidobacteria bacterium]|nr:DeoR family transcriptional regulator [Acidobacteriota bacterium]